MQTKISYIQKKLLYNPKKFNCKILFMSYFNERFYLCFVKQQIKQDINVFFKLYNAYIEIIAFENRDWKKVRLTIKGLYRHQHYNKCGALPHSAGKFIYYISLTLLYLKRCINHLNLCLFVTKLFHKIYRENTFYSLILNPLIDRFYKTFAYVIF